MNFLKIAPILISDCCTQECLLNLTASEVLKLREKLKSLDSSHQRQWITDRLYEHSGSMVETKFTVAGKEVCKMAWCRVLDVSIKRVSQYMKSINSGQVRIYTMEFCLLESMVQCAN